MSSLSSLIDRFGGEEVVKAANSYGETGLYGAAVGGEVEVARLLLQHGARVDARDRSQKTPLHRAAYSGSVEVATLLIDAGADVEARDEDKVTPLRWAVRNKETDVAVRLMEKGASLKKAKESSNGEERFQEELTDLILFILKQNTKEDVEAILKPILGSMGREKFLKACKRVTMVVVVGEGVVMVVVVVVVVVPLGTFRVRL
jgi:ankyrin repeat protein